MPNSRSPIYWLSAAAACTWLLIIVSGPFLKAAGSFLWPLPYLFFEPLCHQLPERSFYLFGHPLSVCARCSGLYFGFVVGFLTCPWWGRFGRWLLDHPRRLILFMLPTAVDLVLDNTAVTRWMTGMVATLPIGLFVWIAVHQFSLKITRRSCS